MKRGESIPCPYSPSCFTCPMKDCVANFIGISITKLNLLPGDLERARAEQAVVSRKRQTAMA